MYHIRTWTIIMRPFHTNYHSIQTNRSRFFIEFTRNVTIILRIPYFRYYISCIFEDLDYSISETLDSTRSISTSKTLDSIHSVSEDLFGNFRFIRFLKIFPIFSETLDSTRSISTSKTLNSIYSVSENCFDLFFFRNIFRFERTWLDFLHNTCPIIQPIKFFFPHSLNHVQCLLALKS